MKKLLSLLLLATYALAACSRNNDPEPTSTNNNNNTLLNLVTGTWKASFQAEDVNGNHIADEQEKEFLQSENMTITFNIDGSGIVTKPSEGNRPFSWILNEKNIAITSQIDDSTWSDPEIYEVMSITATEMLMRTSFTDLGDSTDLFLGLTR